MQYLLVFFGLMLCLGSPASLLASAPRIILLDSGKTKITEKEVIAVAEKKAFWAKDFRGMNTLAAPLQKTQVALLADGANLYVVAKSAESSNDVVATVEEADGAIWRDDSIELFIRANKDESCYLQVMANTIGFITDNAYAQGGFVKDASWSSGASAVSVRTRDGWTMVLKVPLASLQIDPGMDHWYVQVIRNRPARDKDLSQITTWPAAPEGLQNPASFAAVSLPKEMDTRKFAWVLTPKSYSITKAEDGFTLVQKFQVTNNTGRFHTVKITSLLEGDQDRLGTQDLGLATGKGAEIAVRTPLGTQRKVKGAVRHRLSPVNSEETVLASNTSYVEYEYAPARLVLDVPGYRADLFQTQRHQTIEARLVQQDHAVAISSIQAVLQGENGNEMTAEVSPVADGEWQVKVPGVDQLTPGEYHLAASFSTPDGQSEIRRRIRKLPYREGETWIDKRGLVRREGKPLPIYGFLFGHWRQLTRDRIPSDMFYNFAGPLRIRPPFNEMKKAVTKLHDFGLFVALDVPTASKQGFAKGLGNTPLTPKEREEYIAIIKAAADRPEFAAWYLYDEPEIHGIGPDRMREIYELFVEHDPWRPVIILNAFTDSTRDYQYGADISNPDPYPLFLEGRGASRTLNYIGKFLDEIQTGEESYRAKWVTPQAFNYAFFGRTGNRAPSAREMRTQQVIALIHGATGVTWYPEYLAWDEAGVASSISYLSNEYKALFPHLIAKPPEILRTEDGLEAGLMMSHGYSILLLANPFWETRSFTVTDSRFATVTNWRHLGSDNTLSPSGPTIAVTLAPHESTILVSPEFPVPTNLDWAAVETAEAEILRQAVVPGNIAHISTGAKATLVGASGISPMPFVINGINDPRSTGWVGPIFKPGQGIEITFPKAAKAARVRIFGANIALATVMIKKGEQWIEKAQIKASDNEGPLEATWSGEETTAVRLIASAINPSREPKLSIREVEIYE